MRYKGKRVFVTGAGGFIGSHLTDALLAEGAEVRGLCRYTSHGGRGFLPYHQNLGVIHGDIRDDNAIRYAVTDFEPHIIFHLAALIGIPYSYEAPHSYFEVNVGGALNVLTAAKESLSQPRVILTSTSEVYGTALYTPIDEDHPLQAQSPYAASKIASDKLGESFHLSYRVPIVTIRPFNTYGPRQSSRAVIPTIAYQLLTGDKMELGSLSPRRDMLYVSDTVEGFLLAGLSERVIGKTLNLGTGVSHSVGEIAESMMRIMGKTVPITQASDRIRPENSEVRELLCDPSQARNLLGWLDEIYLVIGLREVFDYVSSHLDQYKGTYAI